MLSMSTRREVAQKLRNKYSKAKTKKEKSAVIDAIIEATGWHRKHAIRVLSGKVSTNKNKSKRGPKFKYNEEHAKVIKLIWAVLDFPCSKRLSASLKDVINALERHGQIKLSFKIKIELLAMSPSTIDRILAPERRKFTLKGRSTTKPGSMLKSQIPIRRGTEWSDTKLGFMEADTVAHCGPSLKGEFCYTLDMTDVSSGWTELICIRNKAEVHMVEAVKNVKARLPFRLKGVDSDNGSEFINAHFLRYCENEDLVFTRSRPYTKNDGCYVEEKNWSVVRRTIGYGRYSGDKACFLINEIYKRQRILTNYFTPSTKLVSRVRDGSKIVRTHDVPQTPYRRILAMKDVGREARQKMKEEFLNADPVQLRLEIKELTDKLLKICEGL